jgi:hypothetical protein
MNHAPWTVSEIPPQTGKLAVVTGANSGNWRSATALDVTSGSYVAPGRLFQLKGEPVLVQIPKPARDQTAARTLWDMSRKLTGVAFAGLS